MGHNRMRSSKGTRRIGRALIRVVVKALAVSAGPATQCALRIASAL